MKVLIALTASAPDDSAANAISSISVTLGVNFTINNFFVKGLILVIKSPTID